MKKIITVVVGLFLLVVLLAGLNACVSVPLVPPKPIRIGDCVKAPDRNQEISRDLPLVKPYFKNEFIILGDGDHISKVINYLSPTVAQINQNSISVNQEERLGDLKLIDRITVTLTTELDTDYIVSDTFGGKDLYQLANPKLNNVEIHLYQYAEGDEVPKVMRNIISYAGKNNLKVYPSPNYVLGNPNHVEGSPNHVEGSPYFIEPTDKIATATVQQEKFWDQWAFREKNGIGLFEHLPRERTVSQTGKGVKVAIFDTSPFRLSGIYSIRWISPNLSLCVWDINKNHYQHKKISQKPDLSDHGLAVAGLVHAVAPKSEIHLIRVLDQAAVGDLYTLLVGLHDFTKEHLRSTIENPVVVNLSLGIPQITETSQFVPDEIIRNLDNVESNKFLKWKEQIDNIIPLHVLLKEMHDRGAVIVAAAGNGSNIKGKKSLQQPSEIPAKHNNVLAVSGGTGEGKDSCFSNKGSIRAPAGGISACSGERITCKDNPQNCLLGLGFRTPSHIPNGYIYSTGTSFAAPLVSGMAALAYEAVDGTTLFDLAPEFKRVYTAMKEKSQFGSLNRVIWYGNEYQSSNEHVIDAIFQAAPDASTNDSIKIANVFHRDILRRRVNKVVTIAIMGSPSNKGSSDQILNVTDFWLLFAEHTFPNDFISEVAVEELGIFELDIFEHQESVDTELLLLGGHYIFVDAAYVNNGTVDGEYEEYLLMLARELANLLGEIEVDVKIEVLPMSEMPDKFDKIQQASNNTASVIILSR